jgi:murein tripeptide amidase MpaA
MKSLALTAVAVLALSATQAQCKTLDSLQTIAEQSGFQKTGRYEEVIDLCQRFQKVFPKEVRCKTFGVSPEGREMKVLVVTRTKAFTAEQASKRKIPVVLIQGGIHAGEIDGKDAGFWALRDVLQNKVDSKVLDNSVVLFVPVFSTDGHERFKAWNRPNQRGPEEMGWRTTAQNLNLNRDYMKAEAPEMQAMLRLINAWDPQVLMDLHATDGAQFQHDISITTMPAITADTALYKQNIALRDEIIAGLAKDGALPVDFYPSFIENDNPASGFANYAATPRFSTGYMPLRNRMAILVETHSWRTYPERVQRTYQTILHLLTALQRDGQQWLQTAAKADEYAKRLAGKTYPLTFVPSKEKIEIEFQGYAYTRTPSEISGALMTRYDESVKQVWKVPYYKNNDVALSIKAPSVGYIIPAAYAETIGNHLQMHGVQFKTLDKNIENADTNTFRASKATFATNSNESNQRLTVEGEWKSERRDIRAGSLFVPIAQANAQLAIHLLEPRAGDSYLAWGRFNAHFEQKEYMEDYVAEEVAREMLSKDSALKAEFNRRLKEDAEFAKSPAARLDFFYRRHSAWDNAYQLYPVLRINTKP